MKPLILLLCSALAVSAQERFPRHMLRIGMGVGLPRGDLRGAFKESYGLSAGYGYRFHRYFQADLGLDTLFGAANVHDFYSTEFGELRIKDYQFLVPAGGRAILPLARGRLQLAGGGGGAYMRYHERLRQPYNDYYRVNCLVCNSRGGWGYYALAGASVALDRFQHFRFGVTSRLYRGHTAGEEFGPVSILRTRDHGVNIFGELSMHF